MTLRRWIGDLPLGRRLGGGIGLILLLSVAIGLISSLGLRDLEDTLARTSSASLEATRAAGDVRSSFNALAKTDQDLLVNRDEDTRAALTERRSDLEAELDEAWAAYLAADPASPASLRDDFAAALATWRFIRGQCLEPLVQAGAVEDWVATYNASVARSSAATINEALSEIAGTEQAAAGERLVEATTVAERAILLVWVGVAVALLLGVLLTVGLSRSITGPVGHVLRVAEAMARGDLTARTGIRRGDEIGRVAAAQDQAADGLRTILSDVAAGSQQVAGAVEQLTGFAGRIETEVGLTTQESAAAADATHKVTTNVNAVALGAEELRESITEISRGAQDALKVAHDATLAAEEATGLVGTLGTSSSQIDEAVRLIAGIAEPRGPARLARASPWSPPRSRSWPGRPRR
ncbi:MCP four helix bundle domain-containing protein [Nocardioides bruguierae]|uniref:Methyl-accepting chemotaxis protein n=1 Tax=Nocardioides bruguierae TaxID=2945102 RepID=A0A9X2ID65_9ACTN|nr:methyl-accepting chemotaxis protein [Nocardioides bruguierae]MCM0619416.1 methyl-accepting chemotaxis protein [Nocardioides bruguierae]